MPFSAPKVLTRVAMSAAALVIASVLVYSLRPSDANTATPAATVPTPPVKLSLSANPSNSTVIYTYDGLNRLTGVKYGDGTTVTYTYDAVGNRSAMKTTVAPGRSFFPLVVTGSAKGW